MEVLLYKDTNDSAYAQSYMSILTLERVKFYTADEIPSLVGFSINPELPEEESTTDCPEG